MTSSEARQWLVRLWPAASFQFCFIGAVAMLKPATNAVLLSRYSSNVLPSLYVFAAVLAGLLAVLSARSSLFRHSPRAAALVAGAGTLLCVACLWSGFSWAAPFAYLLVEVSGTQLSLAFWATVGDTFDAREARRALAFIHGFGMSGAIVAGLAAQSLAASLGATWLLVIGSVLLLLGAAALSFQQRPAEIPNGKLQPVAIQTFLQQPYPRSLAMIVAGFAVIQQLTDFVFRHRAVDQLDEAQMTSVFASHQLWTGVFAVVFQFAAAELLMRRLGVLRYVAAIPVVLAALSVISLVDSSVWSVWVLKLFESASSWSLLPVAMQLLYAPLPDETRDPVRRAIDGLVRKGGMGIAGVFLVGAARLLGADVVLICTVLSCVVLAWLLWRLQPHYLSSVHIRVAGVKPAEVAGSDERFLAEMLRDANPDRAIRAADLLRYAGLARDSHIVELMKHPNDRAREHGVRLAELQGTVAITKGLETVIRDGDRRSRDAAVWVLAKLNPARAEVLLPTLLDSKDPGLLGAAVGGLLSVTRGRHEHAKAVLKELIERAPKSGAAERREIARLLGRVVTEETRSALVVLLDDADLSVRRHAIQSVGAAKRVELAPKVAKLLNRRDERVYARDALAALGIEAVPFLSTLLDDRTQPLSMRLQIPRVLRQIGGQDAFNALLFSNANDEPVLHYRVGSALARLREANHQLIVDEPHRMGALERRTVALSTYAAIDLALGKRFRSGNMLRRAVRDRMRQAGELGFQLIGLRHDTRTWRRAYVHLVGRDARRKAWALELVDETLSSRERAFVQQVLAGGQPKAVPPAEMALSQLHDDLVVALARGMSLIRNHAPIPGSPEAMSDTSIQKVLALENVEIFQESDVDDVAAVAAVARDRSFRAGEKIYGEGDPGDALYVIVSGRVEARRMGEVVLTLRAKESFGETSLFDGAPRVNDVVALTDTEALVIDRRDFLDLISDRPELLTGMFRVMSRQLKAVVVDMSDRIHSGNTAENRIPLDDA